MNARDTSAEAARELKIFRWSSQNEADRFPVENPATGEVIALVQGGGEAEVDAAVRAADAAYHADWRWRSPQERGLVLLRCADHLEKHAQEIAALESQENGKPIGQAAIDVMFMIATFRFFGSLIDKLPGEFYDKGPIYASVVLEPFGVVAGIIPFNWPPVHTGAKAAPALAVGNTVVLKPGEQAPLAIMRIVELLQEVLPPDVLHAVPGRGATAGAALASHPLVRKISFTGSTAAGAAVSRAAAPNITPVLMELGGKNAFIVFEDADLEIAARDALDGGFYNQGEACTAASRILVHRSVHDAFVERLARGVRALRVGAGADPLTQVGPMVTATQQARVQAAIEQAKAEGAQVAAESAVPSDPSLAGGFYVPALLLTGVTRDMLVAKDEVFGPVVTVTIFDTEAEALDIANDSEYGLVAGVYTRDMERAFRASRRLDTGIVFLNNYYRIFLGTPFGGAKHSGFGREHCIQTLQEFGRAKAIRFPSGASPLTPPWPGFEDAWNAMAREPQADS